MDIFVSRRSNCCREAKTPKCNSGSLKWWIRISLFWLFLKVFVPIPCSKGFQKMIQLMKKIRKNSKIDWSLHKFLQHNLNYKMKRRFLHANERNNKSTSHILETIILHKEFALGNKVSVPSLNKSNVTQNSQYSFTFVCAYFKSNELC